MAHMIENEMIAWNQANGEPWHGLGTAVTAGTDAQTMLKLAKLDFKVESMDLELSHLIGQDIVNPVSRFKAIGRRDTNRIFGVQSNRYKIHQNSDILAVFDEYCKAGHAELDVIGGLRGGAVVWALAKLNGRTKLTLPGNDKVEGYLLMVGSHDGTLPTAAYATQQRAVCNNTLFPAMRSGRMGFKMKHSKEWTSNTTKKAQSDMGIAIEAIQEFNEMSESFSRVSLDRKGQIEFISRLMDGKCLLDQVADNTTNQIDVASGFDTDASILDSILSSNPVSYSASASADSDKLNRVGKSILEAIISSPGSTLESAQNTLWGAINGVSYYTDHLAARTQDTRLYNAYFGTSVDMKQSAIDVAKNMAGIN